MFKAHLNYFNTPKFPESAKALPWQRHCEKQIFSNRYLV